MGLIDNAVETYADKAKEEARRIFAVGSNSALQSYLDFWFQADRKTLKSKAVLQAQFDAMGALGKEVMDQHAALQGFLYGLNPWSAQNPKGWKPLSAPYVWSHSNGAVILGDLV